MTKYILPLLLILCVPLMGADKELPKDFKSLKALAEKGDTEAQFILGDMYAKGRGVKQDVKEGYKWRLKAAEKGNADAQHIIGKLYSVGIVVRQSGKEAVKWNRKAAAQGHVMAQIYLRVMYQSGQYGVEKDAKEGFKWGLKAAEQGDRYSQSEIMRLYDKGIGVLQDYVTAYAWAIIVEANGSESAKSFKSRLAKKMTPEEITKAEALSKEMIKKNPKLLQKKK